MGIKERQERDRQAVRRAILDAARDLFVTEGFERVSMRRIAELVEYSPAAIYGYFPSKDDIFFALAEEGFRLLHAQHDFAALEKLPPLERVREIFWRFYLFSRDYPEYFALMFVDRSVPRITREYEAFTFAQEMKRAFTAHLQAVMEAGVIPRVSPDWIGRLVSSALIGAGVMRLSDRLCGEAADEVARDLLDVLLAGLQSGAVRPSASAQCGSACDGVAADRIRVKAEASRRAGAELSYQEPLS
jgi:AcrR family transcriptional regulator